MGITVWAVLHLGWGGGSSPGERRWVTLLRCTASSGVAAGPNGFVLRTKEAHISGARCGAPAWFVGFERLTR